MELRFVLAGSKSNREYLPILGIQNEQNKTKIRRREWESIHDGKYKHLALSLPFNRWQQQKFAWQ